MRIYFAAAHSAGKTTLTRYVSEKYKLPMITECARLILAEQELNINTLRTNLEVVDKFQTSVFYRQLEEEKKYLSFVSDRSLDCLAYAAQHSRILAKITKTIEFEHYVSSLKMKDVIFFFVRPSKATLQEDGTRETINWDEINRIDGMIKCLLELFEIPYFIIDSSSMQERTNLINQIINLKFQTFK